MKLTIIQVTVYGLLAGYMAFISYMFSQPDMFMAPYLIVLVHLITIGLGSMMGAAWQRLMDSIDDAEEANDAA